MMQDTQKLSKLEQMRKNVLKKKKMQSPLKKLSSSHNQPGPEVPINHNEPEKQKEVRAENPQQRADNNKQLNPQIIEQKTVQDPPIQIAVEEKKPKTSNIFQNLKPKLSDSKNIDQISLANNPKSLKLSPTPFQSNHSPNQYQSNLSPNPYQSNLSPNPYQSSQLGISNITVSYDDNLPERDKNNEIKSKKIMIKEAEKIKQALINLESSLKGLQYIQKQMKHNSRFRKKMKSKIHHLRSMFSVE